MREMHELRLTKWQMCRQAEQLCPQLCLKPLSKIHDRALGEMRNHDGTQTGHELNIENAHRAAAARRSVHPGVLDDRQSWCVTHSAGVKEPLSRSAGWEDTKKRTFARGQLSPCPRATCFQMLPHKTECCDVK